MISITVMISITITVTVILLQGKQVAGRDPRAPTLGPTRFGYGVQDVGTGSDRAIGLKL